MAREYGAEGKASTAALAAGAAITRSRVADDIEALADKLAPANLVAEAKQKIAEGIARQSVRSFATVSRAAQLAARTVRKHPVPFALSLVVVVALVWRARRA